jgi:cobalt/nickel transport system ATP-binding protein
MSHHRIVVQNLAFRYPDGQPALHDVSLHVEPDEKVALVGPNGSGKTTLMLNLNGILRPMSGTIKVAEIELTEKTIGQVRSRVGLVFQNPDDQLFSPTVFEDVAFGPLHMGLPDEVVRQRVKNALKSVHMEGYADRVSYHLSVGEKKRIAIATVLSMDPEILVLDEPTSGLDPRARRNLIALLKDCEQQTMLISTHDMRLAYDLCDRVVVLDGGRVVARGPAADILTNAELMEQHGLETPF